MGTGGTSSLQANQLPADAKPEEKDEDDFGPWGTKEDNGEHQPERCVTNNGNRVHHDPGSSKKRPSQGL